MLRCVPEGEVLFEFSSLGYEFFIILEGFTSIYIKMKVPDYEEKKTEMFEMKSLGFKKKKFKRWKSKFDGKKSE